MLIAVAQLDTCTMVPGEAARRLLDSVRVAADAGARLVVCPYATLLSPASPDIADQGDYLVEATETLNRISREAACPVILCGGIDMNGMGGSMAMYVHDGAVQPLSVGEPVGALPGAVSEIELDGLRLALACTHDDLEYLMEEKTDANVVIFANAHSFCASDTLSSMGSGYLEGTLSTIAQELDAWFVGAASLGGYGEDIFCGASFVVTPWGELAAHAPAFEEYLLMYDIDARSEGPLEAPDEPDFFDRPLMVWLALRLGLADLMRAQGVRDVLVALDGSLNSALLCVLASDALGPTHVHALVPATLDEVRARWARDVASALGVVCHEPKRMPLRMARDEVAVARVAQGELARLAAELDALPLLSFDKTALALEPERLGLFVGWLAPFGDLYRLDLMELARLRNTISPVIPRDCIQVIDVPNITELDGVSALPRERLEFADMIVLGRVEGMHTPSELVDSYGHPKVIEALVRRMDAAAPLRRGVRVLRVSGRALADYAQPLGFAWKNTVDNAPAMGRLEALTAQLLVGELPPEVEPSQVGEMLGLLRDIADTSSSTSTLNPGTSTGLGRQFPFPFGFPFSEN